MAKKDITHGMTGTRIYTIWAAMKRRCYNPKAWNYSRYGGRGIYVCDEWHRFEAFYRDMGERPGPGYSIDRIDNDGPYAPWNCKWSTLLEQRANSSHLRWIEHDGRRQTMTQWANEVGISPRLLFTRLKLGWPVHRAIAPLERKGWLLRRNQADLSGK